MDGTLRDELLDVLERIRIYSESKTASEPRPAHRVYYQAADREVAPLKKLPSCLREQLDLRDLPIERRQSGRHLLHGAQRGRTAGP